ncbi:hypothetical protein KC356_g311 [Hortaea werneckii]|nr:hypothetical protein KC356_g311 [Hortaea werneckii]
MRIATPIQSMAEPLRDKELNRVATRNDAAFVTPTHRSSGSSRPRELPKKRTPNVVSKKRSCSSSQIVKELAAKPTQRRSVTSVQSPPHRDRGSGIFRICRAGQRPTSVAATPVMPAPNAAVCAIGTSGKKPTAAPTHAPATVPAAPHSAKIAKALAKATAQPKVLDLICSKSLISFLQGFAFSIYLSYGSLFCGRWRSSRGVFRAAKNALLRVHPESGFDLIIRLASVITLNVHSMISHDHKQSSRPWQGDPVHSDVLHGRRLAGKGAHSLRCPQYVVYYLLAGVEQMLHQIVLVNGGAGEVRACIDEGRQRARRQSLQPLQRRRRRVGDERAQKRIPCQIPSDASILFLPILLCSLGARWVVRRIRSGSGGRAERAGSRLGRGLCRCHGKFYASVKQHQKAMLRFELDREPLVIRLQIALGGGRLSRLVILHLRTLLIINKANPQTRPTAPRGTQVSLSPPRIESAKAETKIHRAGPKMVKTLSNSDPSPPEAPAAVHVAKSSQKKEKPMMDMVNRHHGRKSADFSFSPLRGVSNSMKLLAGSFSSVTGSIPTRDDKNDQQDDEQGLHRTAVRDVAVIAPQQALQCSSHDVSVSGWTGCAVSVYGWQACGGYFIGRLARIYAPQARDGTPNSLWWRICDVAGFEG